MRPLQLKERHYLLVLKNTKRLKGRLSQLPEGRPLGSYPLKRRVKYLSRFLPFQFSEVSEHSKSAVTGSRIGTANDPVTTGKK